jgi:hypothetical protein
MPELSRFLGIIIAMYYRDHGPPHFHAIYGEYEATINIATGAVTGELPKRALNHVQEWGFYPDSADTFTKAHNEPKECPCRSASVTALSTSGS